MTTTPYLKTFKTENEAMDWMRMKNRACRAAGNARELYCVTDGPADDIAVVDLRTAVELGNGYKWEV